MHGFGSKKFTTIYDRVAIKMDRCLQEVHIPEWKTKRRITLIQKDPLKGTAPNNNVTTYDVENNNGTNKGGDLFLAKKPRIVH